MKGGIRKRSSGSWQLIINLGRDKHGVRRRKTETVHGTKAQAEKRLRELLSDLDRGIKPPERISVREWLQVWMEELISPNLRQSTKERYQRAINRHIVPRLGRIQLDQLTPGQIQRLESELLERGMSPGGVQLVHNVLSGALKYAVRMDRIIRNPIDRVTRPSYRKPEVSPPEMDDVRQLLALAETQGHYLWPCMHLIAFTGLRRGEALALEWDSIDLDQGRLLVKASLARTGELGLIIELPKTKAGERVVDLDTGTVDVLRRHKAHQEYLAAELRIQPSQIVFPRQGGGWLSPNTLTRTVGQLGREAGCDNMSVRNLRHFHATVALQTGQNVVVISKRLGHSDVTMTYNTYAHVLPGWQKEAAEAFAQAMNETG